MALSKKHYEQFAYRFRNTLENIEASLPGSRNIEKRETAKQAIKGLATSMSVDFTLDNAAFDRARFLAACGF